jgi:SpoVK/Ycf46/Vps4 family AAA+-type ATPase
MGNSVVSTADIVTIRLKRTDMGFNNLKGPRPVPASLAIDSMPTEASGEEMEVDKDRGMVPKLWSVYGDTFSPCEKATKELPAGHYSIRVSNERGIFFAKKEIASDELMILPDTASDDVIASIESFWTKKEQYRAFKFLWKRGILLYGPPGSGKTCTVQIVANKIVEKGGLAIYVSNPQLTIQGLDLLRYIEPDRPVVVILEDIDAIIEKFGESDLLSLLDGEFQVDNAVFLATTNYPEELDDRIKNRPSRFDIVRKIGMPSEAARKMYLTAKNPRIKDNEEELARWVKDTNEFSIAHMKELIISIECLELPYAECIERLEKMRNSDISSRDDRPGIRF